MKAAPAVAVTVDAAGASLAVVSLLCLVALAALGVWAAQRAALGPYVMCAFAFLACASGLVALARRSPERLSWDGQLWHLQATNEASEVQGGQLSVALDFGDWLLLRFCADEPRIGRRARWLPIRRSQEPTRWHALRCAVHSPAPSDAAQAVQG